MDYSVNPNNTIGIFDGKSGDLVQTITPEGTCLRVSRRKLRAFIEEGVEIQVSIASPGVLTGALSANSNIQWGHTLEDLTYGDDGTVTASFTNGKTATGTLIVGADGTRSTIRAHLFGAEKATATPLNVVYSNVAFRYGDKDKALQARSAHPVTSIMEHPDCITFISAQDIPNPDQPENWRFQLVVCWQGDPKDIKGLSNEEKHRQIKDKVKNLAEVR